MMRLLCCSVVLSLVMLSLAAEPKGAPLPPLPTFGCRPYEILPDEKTPTDVNKLRPHDIKAVIAFGDSMTAAFGAKAGKFLSGEPYVPREDRYTSFSGGGGSLQLTLPNMIGVYNRNVQGGYARCSMPNDQAGVVAVVGIDDDGSVVMLVIQCHWSRSSSWYASSSSE